MNKTKKNKTMVTIPFFNPNTKLNKTEKAISIINKINHTLINV